MHRGHRFLALAVPPIVARPAFACEPVVPFMQVMVPALALSGSILVLAATVVVKSALFAVFERCLPPLRAAWRMFLGNVLTSFVGLLVAVMIASSAGIWFIGVPLVCFLCWLLSRRLVKLAPVAWLARTPPGNLAIIMTGALLASCVLFTAGQGAIRTHQLVLYWITKLVAIFWLCSQASRSPQSGKNGSSGASARAPEGTGFFATVFRTNLYVLVLVMAVPAVLILPKRLKSPDFLAKRPSAAVAQTTAPSN